MDKTILIEKIKVDNEKKRAEYHESIEDATKRIELEDLFLRDKEARDNDVKRYFNERTLESFLDDCQKRVNGYVEPRSQVDPDDWKTRYRSLMTRNKMLAILAKLATIRMKMDFKNKRGNHDPKQLKIFNALHHHHGDLDNEDMKQMMIMWNAWQDGTVVVWEHPEKQTQKVKVVQSYDPENGDIKYLEKQIQYFMHTAFILPLQDVWFGNLREPDVQKQSHVWLRFEKSYQDFIKEYGKLKKSKYVQVTTGDSGIDDVFYRKDEIGQNKVEVLYYMNKWEDRMVILANKVMLYDGPLPFGEEEYGKHYPLAVGGGELIAPDFVYRKSGADKLRYDQDMIDLAYRLLADGTILTANPIIFSEGNEDLPEKINQIPGRIYPVNSLAGIREFALQSKNNEIIQMLQTFTNAAEQTSVSSASSGNAQPDRTATADAIAEQAVKQLVGLFQFFIEDLFKQFHWVRAQHELQFISIPERTVIEGEQIKFDYGVFTDENVILEDGSRGDIVYQIVGSADELPTQEELDIKEEVTIRKGYNVRYKFVTPDFFEGLLAQVKPVIGSVLEQSDALKRQLELQFQQGFATLFPQIYMQNASEFAKDYVEIWERDVDRLLGSNQQAMPSNIAQMGIPQAQVPQAQTQGLEAQIPNSIRQVAQV